MKAASPVLLKEKQFSLLTEKVADGPDEANYHPLPMIRASDGMITSRFKLTWRERWTLLWTGNLYYQQLTFHDKIGPVKLSVDEPRPEELL